MSLNYVNLVARVRAYMQDEIAADVAAGRLYISGRLTAHGAEGWADLLQQAAAHGNDESLAEQLNSNGRLSELEERRKPKGGTTMARVPVTAAVTLAEGEFNRLYIRALSRLAMDDGIPQLIVYRAKEVSSPRRDSEEKIGAGVDPRQLLADLRANPGVDTALGLPAGPNSGLSVRLP